MDILSNGMLIVFKIILTIIRKFRKLKRKIFLINCNIKKIDRSVLDEFHPLEASVIEIVSSKENHKYRPKKHFYKMKKAHIRLFNASKYERQLYYFGYVSVPFAFFDGYALSSERDLKAIYVSRDNKSKKIFDKPRVKHMDVTKMFDEVHGSKTVNILISSSKVVNANKINNSWPNINIDNIQELLTIDYIENIFNIFYHCLEKAREIGITKINVFSACMQPVSLFLGTAIENHHPEIIVYEFEDAEYKWGLNIKKGKFEYEKP